jgi:hypothetical protein
MQYVASADQIADVLTKPLTGMMGMEDRWEAEAR